MIHLAQLQIDVDTGADEAVSGIVTAAVATTIISALFWGFIAYLIFRQVRLRRERIEYEERAHRSYIEREEQEHRKRMDRLEQQEMDRRTTLRLEEIELRKLQSKQTVEPNFENIERK